MIDIHSQALSLRWKNQSLDLHPARAIYWRDQHALLVADLHLGKAGHFRRNGIPVPQELAQGTLSRLEQVIRHYQPKELLILGDLFHSVHNPEWELFGDFLSNFPTIVCTLVRGNHDILSDYQYEKFNLEVLSGLHARGPFLLSHEPVEDIEDDKYLLAGHVHPGVRLRGKARQGMRLPCFYFGEKSAFLPAFGDFTGLGIMRPGKGDRVFVIAGERVVEIES